MIQIDSREQRFSHITAVFDMLGIKWFRSKLPVGDYALLDNMRLTIDRKNSLQEIAGNVCQGHARFKRELELADQLGITLVILIEDGKLKRLGDINAWYNPRLRYSHQALTGRKLFKILFALQQKHPNLRFEFCSNTDTARKILEILGVK